MLAVRVDERAGAKCRDGVAFSDSGEDAVHILVEQPTVDLIGEDE